MFKKDAILLENVQRRATKMIPALKDVPYPERLTKLHLPSLYYRRAGGDMIQAYKHMTGLYKVNTRYMKLDTTNTRGHQYKLRKERACHTTRRNFFTGRITNTWNSLPTAVAEAPSMNAFKARLDKPWSCFKYSQLSVHANFNFAKPVNDRPGTDKGY